MDDEWCRRAVRLAADPNADLSGVGVLDPGCGSGTFLRAAVNRLKLFATEVSDDLVEQSNIICRLVHGLDIHPVAVEIATATLLSALPAVPTDGTSAVRIYLADSLRWVLTTNQRIIDQGGLLIEVPDDQSGDKRYLQIPPEAVSDVRFPELLNDLMTYSDDATVMKSRIASYGFEAGAASELNETASLLRQLRAENRNHVWLWYIENVAQAHRFHIRKFDRLVGNPPWITRRDLDASRQALHRQEATKLGLWVGGATYATHNNYAALFAATSIRDYMERRTPWYVGIVMPWSTLRSKVWENFRSGKWSKSENGVRQDEWQSDMSELAWDLRYVSEPPFRQSESCVLFAKRAGSSDFEFSRSYEEWRGKAIEHSGSWAEIKPRIQRTVKTSALQEQSPYFDLARNGATIFPYGLVKIDNDSLESGGTGITRFTTVPSNRAPWRGISLQGQVEDRYIRQVVFSTDIAPFRLFSKSYAVLPDLKILQSERPDVEMAGVQHFGRYWSRIDRIWRKKNGRATLPRT